MSHVEVSKFGTSGIFSYHFGIIGDLLFVDLVKDKLPLPYLGGNFGWLRHCIVGGMPHLTLYFPPHCQPGWAFENYGVGGKACGSNRYYI